MHKRTEIKAKFIEMMQTGITANVYNSRYLPINKSDLPAISVYCPEDTSDIAASGEHYDRVARVVVACYCKGYDPIELTGTDQNDIDSELDDLCGEVETLFCTKNQALGGLASQVLLVKTRYMIKTEGDDITGVAYIDFDVHYKDSIL
jgi:hypothetical protein